MPHPCHRCNATVDEGKPFCSQCGAPQIKVQPPTVAETERFASPPLPHAAQRHSIRWSSALPKAAAAGFLSVVFMLALGQLAPLFQLLAIPVVAALTVWLYARSQKYPALTAGAGMRIGLVTGFMCFLVTALILAAQITSNREQFFTMLRDQLQQAAARQPGPQSQQIVEQLLSPGGLTLIVILGGMLSLFVFLVLGLIGGSLAASSLRGRAQRL